MAQILLERASLSFRVRRQRQITIKEYLLKGMYLRRHNPLVEIRALQDLSLDLRDGARIGVLGSNGAGKSTLLRLLAGVYPPTSGRRTVHGRVSSLFELNLGFEMEANGWQNIRNRGFLQGETPRSLRAKTREIADFSELGKFLDLPVRYYSAGMLVRLAFAIATAVEPEVLLIDEVLAAGDLAFQAKAARRLQEMVARARLLVVVSHDLAALVRLCDTGLWLEHGRVQQLGPIAEVIAAYQEHVRDCQLQPA